MKFHSKGVQVLKGSSGYMLLIPAPLTEDLNNIKVDGDYSIEIKRHSEKRSLNANSYCWVLCQAIAERLSRDGQYISKEEVYQTCIKNSQQMQHLLIQSKAAPAFRRSWERNGIGFQVVEIGPSKDHAGYEWIGLYAGSSTYSVAEMSRLLDCLVDEAHQVGAETEPPDYVQALLDDWGEAG
jgi:uncharacterized protein YifN (PemK superfamily)